jgi:cupin fold WbuC family metalloprotein
MKIVTAPMIADLLARAAEAPRKRINLNLHADPSDPTNRFLNAGIAGTYVQPHRHRSGRWELLSVLRGKLDILIFAPGGEITRRLVLDSEVAALVEIPGGAWHTFVFRAPGAAVLEIKPGPYEPEFDKEFAAWAPAEGDPAAAAFLDWLERAPVGEAWRAGAPPTRGPKGRLSRSPSAN